MVEVDTIKQCQYCKKQHDGTYGSGRFCSVDCANKSRTFKRSRTIAFKRRKGLYDKGYIPKTSKLQNNVSLNLSRMGIVHQTQYKVGKFYFDIRIGRTLIQINGTFWHADPRVYKATDFVQFPGRKKRASTIWKRDNDKRLFAMKKGYKVLYLWESDINKMNPIQLAETVKKMVGLGVYGVDNNQKQQQDKKLKNYKEKIIL